MKSVAWLCISVYLVLAVNVAGVQARAIQPSGDRVGIDKQGNTIYQVQSNGIKMAYKLIGSGDPLVMIMGLGGTMDDWPNQMIESLAQKYQLVLFDNRGMGHSTADNKTFSYGLLASDVVRLLDTIGIRKANVLGYSMGSAITQELLLEYPQYVNKAIIYATTTDGTTVVAALKGRTPPNPTIEKQLEATAQWRTPLAKLPSISSQVMVIVGTSDSVVGVESSKQLAQAIPGAWLVQFKNATHSLMREAPADFARIVSTFLDIDETVKLKKEESGSKR